ncbi:MAG: hypothetical protein RBS55_08240 [Bacteroidales bacterium]|jgi:hypothetical protein|nr:hypothetical protein [Bacteroidales bacterium]
MTGNFKRVIFILLLISAAGCGPNPNKGQIPETRIQKIKVKNYGQALFSLDPMNVKQGLDSLSSEFSIFTGVDPDTLQALQIREFIMDPLNRELAAGCAEKFPSLEFLNIELTDCFAAVKRADTTFNIPEVYTYVSGLIYESPVEYADSVMVIAMDLFLGWDYQPYRAAGIPVYMTRRMERQNIVPECARQIAISKIPTRFEPKTLLDFMILHGKVLYALDKYLPGTPDSLKMGYTSDQSAWCNSNEANIWRMLIDQEVLYSTESFANNRFIMDGPFTSGLPDGAPAMLGRWIGWQIIRSYMMKNPGISLEELFAQNDSQAILSNSGYKPKR